MIFQGIRRVGQQIASFAHPPPNRFATFLTKFLRLRSDSINISNKRQNASRNAFRKEYLALDRNNEKQNSNVFLKSIKFNSEIDSSKEIVRRLDVFANIKNTISYEDILLLKNQINEYRSSTAKAAIKREKARGNKLEIAGTGAMAMAMKDARVNELTLYAIRNIRVYCKKNGEEQNVGVPQESILLKGDFNALSTIIAQKKQ